MQKTILFKKLFNRLSDRTFYQFSNVAALLQTHTQSRLSAEQPSLINAWNDILEIESGKWRVNFFFNYPTISKLTAQKYSVQCNSIFGIAMVESQKKYMKGTPRFSYTFNFKESMRLFAMNLSNPDLYNFYKPINQEVKRHLMVTSKNQQVHFSLFDMNKSAEVITNTKKFTLKHHQFEMLRHILKLASFELSGRQAQFILGYGSYMRQSTDQRKHVERQIEQTSYEALIEKEGFVF